MRYNIKGLACQFGVIDDVNDMFLPGAFKYSLSELKAGRLWLPILLDHTDRRIVGSVSRAREVKDGLLIEAEIDTDCFGSKAERIAFERGYTRGLSVCGKTHTVAPEPARKGKPTGGKADGIHRISCMELKEISLVRFPAVPGSYISVIQVIDDEGE